MRRIGIAIGCFVVSVSVAGQSVSFRSLDDSSQNRSMVVSAENRLPAENNLSASAPWHTRVGIVSDWTQRRTLYPVSKNLAVMTRIQKDPRYTQEWYLRHREIWWPGTGRGRLRPLNLVHRDWSVPLGFTGPYSSISAITQTGTTVTVATTPDHVFVAGQAILISGISAGTGGCSSAAAAAIDGVQTITGAGYETIIFTSSHFGTITSGECTLAANAAAVGPTPFQPLDDFAFNIGNTGFGSVNTIDLDGLNTGDAGFNASYLVTGGTLTLTASEDPNVNTGTYPLDPGGPYTTEVGTSGDIYTNTVLPGMNPPLPNSYAGLMFTNSVDYINLFYEGGAYNDWDLDEPMACCDQINGGTFTLNTNPGGGQTWPAKYTFDVTATPSCADDFVAIGIPANAVAGAQANIVGYNNLYSGSGGLCGSTPSVMFAYASGTGEVPGSISISPNGTQLAYIEDQLTGSSVFHLLTIGTNAGKEGTSPTDPVTPGANGSGALDTTLALSSGSCAAQSSTTSPFIRYTTNDAYPDAAYVTTYAWTGAGTGTGCLYKISPVFSGGAPTITWSVPISAVPSSPVYDTTSNEVFFTDSSGNIDYVTDTGTPSTYNSLAVAAGTTSENPPTVDSVDEMVYATFNTNGTDALVAQSPINTGGTLGTAVTVPVGLGNTLFTGPYGVDFSNAWYTNGPASAGALLYVAGTDTSTGMVPTLYNVGFNGSGVLNATANPSTPLATSTNALTGFATVADSSAVTEFFNANDTTGGPDGTDYLFVGVSDSCAATANGGDAGCVMSLGITSGAPTVSATTTNAIAAPGGSTGIIVDNEADTTNYPQASSAYYETKTGGTLVKATQNGLD